MFRRVSTLCCAAAGLITASANGQSVLLFDSTADRPSGYRLPIGEWSFVAVVDRDASGSASIVGVMALFDMDKATGDNIVSVWYERPTTAGSDWPTKAWESQDQWAAIKWAKDTYSIADDFDLLWPTKDEPSGAAAELPAEYYQGVLATDPMATIMDDPNRDAIVELLTSIGYKSADIAIEKHEGCEAKLVLDGYTVATEFAVVTFGPGGEGWGQDTWNGYEPDSVVDLLLSTQVPASCLPIIGVAPISAVVPAGPSTGPVIPGSSVPLPPGATPLNPGRGFQQDSQLPKRAPSCDGVNSCCYRQSVIVLYIDGYTIRQCTAHIEYSCPAAPDGSCPTLPTCQATVPSGQGYDPPAGSTYRCGRRYM